MVQEKIKREWEVTLQGLNVKQDELTNRASEIEGEIERLQEELDQYRVKRYRTELAGRLKRSFSHTFRERDGLIEPRFGSMQEWNVCSLRLRAYIIIRDSLDSEEGNACRNVSGLKSYLQARLNSELEGNVEEETLDLL